MIVPDGIKETVGVLYAGQGEAAEPAGLCFGLNWVEGQSVFNYLVTSRHVIESLGNRRAAIRPGAGRRGSELGEASPLPGCWVFHADSAVDVAVWPRVSLAETTSALLGA